MKLVSSYGSIYRVSNTEYGKQLMSIIQGQGYRLNPACYLGEVECNLTDLTVDEARELLAEHSRPDTRPKPRRVAGGPRAKKEPAANAAEPTEPEYSFQGKWRIK